MKPTIATRFCCRRPSFNLTQLTLMFTTLILQYLNKLVKGEVRDFTSPKPFHTLKVQRFNGDGIKPLTEFRGKLPMKVFTLIRDLPIEACELPNTTPSAIRTFLFTTQCFVAATKFLQGVFQRLGMLFFFTRAKRQIRLFHTEVCPNALTCCW